MKKTFFLFIVLTCLCVTKTSLAQEEHPPVLKQLILGIPATCSRNYDDIKSKLSSMGGVTLLGYCGQYKCFLLTYDANKIESADAIVKSMEEYKSEYKSEIKEGTTIAKLIGSCIQFGTETGDNSTTE